MTVRALYPLSRRIAGFEFFPWLLLAKAHGAAEVIFDPRYPRTSKWDEAAVLRRYGSILRPGPALAGMPSREGEGGSEFFGTHLSLLVNHVRGGGKVDRLHSVLPAGGARYTVTLRQTERRPERNSNERAWRAFAAEIGARVIEDWDREPIDLHARVALYAGAAMNFFVTNGPMQLCSLTPYPMMCFGAPVAEGALGNIGIRPGGQFPWCGPDQRLIWEPDELPVLRRVFNAWREERPMRKAAS